MKEGAFVLILHDWDDTSAPWLAEALREQHNVPCLCVSGEDLLSATIEHSVCPDSCKYRVTLASGHQFHEGTYALVLNRLNTPSHALPLAFEEDDASYAMAEQAAALVSLICANSGRIVNAPRIGLLSGTWRTKSDWDILALRSGLEVAAVEHKAANTELVLALEGQLLGAVCPPPVAQGIRRMLSEHAGNLLGITFRVVEGDWYVDSVSTCPDLRTLGNAIVHAFRTLLADA